jgi:predicted ATP-grasp superfamily ATP-dependent carboligase
VSVRKRERDYQQSVSVRERGREIGKDNIIVQSFCRGVQPVAIAITTRVLDYFHFNNPVAVFTNRRLSGY